MNDAGTLHCVVGFGSCPTDADAWPMLMSEVVGGDDEDELNMMGGHVEEGFPQQFGDDSDVESEVDVKELFLETAKAKAEKKEEGGLQKADS